MADRPTIQAAVSWTTNPAATPVWVDATAYVRAFSLTRGRNHELDQAQAGTATLTLKNTDRRFDPLATGYSAGPYGSNVIPMRRVRIQATYSATTYDLFHGYITAYQPTIAPSNSDALMELSLVDAFGPLARYKVNTTRSAETTDLRIAAVLNAIGWPAGDRTLATGLIQTQAATLVNEDALGHLQAIVDDEKGFLFISKDGKVTFQHRYMRLLPTATSAVVLGDGGGSEELYEDVDFSVDDSRIMNDVRVTRAGGIEQVVTDATSQANYYIRTQALSGLMQWDGDAYGTAGYLLETYKQPRLRAPGLRLNGDGNPTVMWPHVCGRELGDRVTLRRRPPGGGATIDQICHIEQMTIDWTAVGGAWSVGWEVSPGDATQYWSVGHATYGVLSSTTRLAP